MTACLFIGPSLTVAEAQALFDGVCLPPARQGDVHLAVERHRPTAVGLVDGYFHQVPAVCHKEILWTLAQGIPVLGAASMGALRAAELAAFGMRGVGRVFEAYRDGTFPPYDAPFEDDDEVAVQHAPADLGYAALSEAMVNIRATLAAAQIAGVIDVTVRDQMVEFGKRLFYPRRSYENIFAMASKHGLPNDKLAALASWLPSGRIDQKREDAVALVAALHGASRGPVAVDFDLAHTTMWEAVVLRNRN